MWKKGNVAVAMSWSSPECGQGPREAQSLLYWRSNIITARSKWGETVYQWGDRNVIRLELGFIFRATSFLIWCVLNTSHTLSPVSLQRLWGRNNYYPCFVLHRTLRSWIWEVWQRCCLILLSCVTSEDTLLNPVRRPPSTRRRWKKWSGMCWTVTLWVGIILCTSQFYR